MNEPPDESQPFSSAALLAEINDKLDRTLSTAAQASLQAARTVRMVNANMQLDARNHMALVDTFDQFKRTVQKLGQIVEKLHGNRPPSLTVVQDVPSEPAREDITQTHFLGQPWVGVKVLGKRIPSKVVARGFVVIVAFAFAVGLVAGYFGLSPLLVAKKAAPLMVAP